MKNMETTNIKREIEYTGFDGPWLMEITYDHKIIVSKDGEQREYDSPEPIIKIKHDTEYVFLRLESHNILQFKFEFDSFLVGDLFNPSFGEHIDEFASHVFGEG